MSRRLMGSAAVLVLLLCGSLPAGSQEQGNVIEQPAPGGSAAAPGLNRPDGGDDDAGAPGNRLHVANVLSDNVQVGDLPSADRLDTVAISIANFDLPASINSNPGGNISIDIPIGVGRVAAGEDFTILIGNVSTTTANGPVRISGTIEGTFVDGRLEVSVRVTLESDFVYPPNGDPDFEPGAGNVPVLVGPNKEIVAGRTRSRWIKVGRDVRRLKRSLRATLVLFSRDYPDVDAAGGDVRKESTTYDPDQSTEK